LVDVNTHRLLVAKILRFAGRAACSGKEWHGVPWLPWLRHLSLALAICVFVVWQGGMLESSAAYQPLAGPEAMPTPPVPVEHLWLSRPVGERAVRITPDRFYPYGSTGQGQYQVHHGVEFVNPSGTPVFAAADGTVVVAGSDDRQLWGRHLGYYGRLIVIRVEHTYGGAPVYVLYGHLSRVGVRLGQHVRQGEEIGLVGSSGVALGPHLHFEVRVGRNAFSHTRNPELWLKPLPGHGTIIVRIESAYGRPVPGALVTFRPVQRPDRHWREAWTYSDASREQIRADDVWRENGVMGDVPVGVYLVAVRIDGQLHVRQIEVADGQIARVAFRARAVQDSLDASEIPR
jgi:peptidase M23-like protein